MPESFRSFVVHVGAGIVSIGMASIPGTCLSFVPVLGLSISATHIAPPSCAAATATAAAASTSATETSITWASTSTCSPVAAPHTDILITIVAANVGLWFDRLAADIVSYGDAAAHGIVTTAAATAAAAHVAHYTAVNLSGGVGIVANICCVNTVVANIVAPNYIVVTANTRTCTSHWIVRTSIAATGTTAIPIRTGTNST